MNRALTLGLPIAFALFAESAAAEGAFQGTGIKIGEVTASSAIVWTRITAFAERRPVDMPTIEVRYVGGKHDAPRRRGVVDEVVFPPGATVDDLPGAAPGAPGETRVRYRESGSISWQATPWEAVDPNRDFTRQHLLDGLSSDAEYDLVVEARRVGGESIGSRVDGGFRTAPEPTEPARVVFTVATCQGNNDQDTDRGFRIYRTMLDLEPSFFVHTGDLVYYDKVAKTLPLARYLWGRLWSWPHHRSFHSRVPSYFEKDDHDTWVNDCWPTMATEYMHEFTFEQGLGVFREQVPTGSLTYRTFRWGKDLQVWLVENRDFRSSNKAPDGPDKTIWGDAQKTWFKRTVGESDATFRVLISPTPMVGPDRSKKNDNHANAGFRHEGDELRAFLASQKNMVVICGDRHWQYHSVDPTTGLREYSCGPASNAHAGGWNQEDYFPEYHRFLAVKGGFLSGTVDREEDTPRLTLRFHGVRGAVRHTDTLVAQ